MPTDGDGHHSRLDDLNGARPTPRRRKPVDLTPDEARALIDTVFRSLGLNPAECIDPQGWRHLSLGSAHGLVGVVEWEPGDHHLVVFSPIVELPDDVDQLAQFFRILLELNHNDTHSARFSLRDRLVHLSLSRPIRGLDEEEVEDAIRTVMAVADTYDDRLEAALAQFVIAATLPWDQLPKVRLTPKETQNLAGVLGRCDLHGRDIFRYILEGWQKSGYLLSPTESAVGLHVPFGRKRYDLGAIRRGIGDPRQLILLGWESLRQRGRYPSKAVDRFQRQVSKITDPKITESSAHIEVTEDFDLDAAKALLRAMRALAKTAQAEPERKPFEWPQDLPKMDIKVGGKTLQHMATTLQACEPRVQDLYATLIEGWNQAGGIVQCARPGRIYLKFQSREHDFGEYGWQSHKFNLAVPAAPKGKRGPNIEVDWGLATREFAYLDYIPEDVARFEAIVAGLPGFEQSGAITRLNVTDKFLTEQAQILLQAMLDLKAAGGA
ncbi:YbjN domain-containing protein [Chloroflexota bacterium]